MSEEHQERETVELIERIPHKSVAYAYVEVRASNANAFMAARSEFLKKHPAYQWALDAPAGPKTVGAPTGAQVPAPSGKAVSSGAPAPVEEDQAAPAEPEVGSAVEPARAPDPSPASSASSPGQTAREKARARMAAKKEGS